MIGYLLYGLMVALAAIPGVLIARYARRLGKSRLVATFVGIGSMIYCLPFALPLAVVFLALTGIDVFD